MRRSRSGPLASGRIESGTSYKKGAQRVLVRKRHKLGTASAAPAMQWVVVHQLLHQQQHTPTIVRTSGEGLSGMATVGVGTAQQPRPAAVAVLGVEGLVVLLTAVPATGTAAITSLGMPSPPLRRLALQVQHTIDRRQLRAAMTTGEVAATAANTATLVTQAAVMTHTGAGGSA